jgi:hypothetical protein
MHTPIQEYIMTGGPPAPIPTIKTPDKALQLFVKASVSIRARQADGDWITPSDDAEGEAYHAQQTK